MCDGLLPEGVAMKRSVSGLVFISMLVIGAVACQQQSPPAGRGEAPHAPQPAESAREASPSQTAARAQEAPRASTPEPAPTPTPAPPPVVPAGTALALTLETPVASNTSQAGDPVVATLAKDIPAEGDAILPAGTEVRGRVVSAQQSGRVKGRARLVLEFTEVRLGGERHAIEASRVDVTAESSKGRDAKIVGGAAAGGALIGAIADGGSGAVKGGLIGGAAGGGAVLATRGQEVSFKTGARVTVKLEQPLTL
jgi:hypothetical protein